MGDRVLMGAGSLSSLAPGGRIFLLSPANCSGRRARQLLAPASRFWLAERLRSREGAALGDVFTYVSGLYFRGKITYATRFAHPPSLHDPIIGSGVHVITPSAGLVSPDTLVTEATLKKYAGVDVHLGSVKYRRPLEQSARALAKAAGTDCDVVLLGSIASPKYVDVLLQIFGEALRFPIDFVGRGDMSRGGLLLRKAAAGLELQYVCVAGAVRHGPRPPKLEPLRRIAGLQGGGIAEKQDDRTAGLQKRNMSEISD